MHFLKHHIYDNLLTLNSHSLKHDFAVNLKLWGLKKAISVVC